MEKTASIKNLKASARGMLRRLLERAHKHGMNLNYSTYRAAKDRITEIEVFEQYEDFVGDCRYLRGLLAQMEKNEKVNFWYFNRHAKGTI